MKRFFLTLILYMHQVFTLSISHEDAYLIGEKIWKNECSSSKEKLTHWNVGENFASLGIGHFIWYPKNEPKKFQETFPNLINFLKAHGAMLPLWLEATASCPWDSRETFYANIQCQEMKELRAFLYETRALQAIFIAQRLEPAIEEILKLSPENSREHIAKTFEALSKSGKGLYAMIDYLNFKGAGTSPDEKYEGEGWGLFQVLQFMPAVSESPIQDFIASAKKVLMTRVQNAPPERNEARWLPGWLNRIATYL
ncbi:hypothetical protein [Simkania negevensis]|uniref:Uncharacterized protein n=1 Tax=Simkania negevensis (strain ATCC VR-1471 / DSM 27360 / Z) TaxID=331113 RepID=F8L457_SIMNZ|nr:hypothetical protein [Simkania negevensis]CCB90095.1 putative uncharacterized protein [Simkania negevensis Z]